jgi:hypothetical protein
VLVADEEEEGERVRERERDWGTEGMSTFGRRLSDEEGACIHNPSTRTLGPEHVGHGPGIMVSGKAPMC